uniref:Uncharacterized protein n=1 Tax=Picea sitchensis TaxID=3332 RepID=A0A6B9XV06_PICSI|nr:hypothetical protein Q903MT_gene6799 [Picea sitchensis]
MRISYPHLLCASLMRYAISASRLSALLSILLESSKLAPIRSNSSKLAPIRKSLGSSPIQNPIDPTELDPYVVDPIRVPIAADPDPELPVLEPAS